MTRPLLHHTVRSGWVNDPHALVHHDGRYHLFFQHVPEQAVWDVACHWGHSVSEDLLTWREQPVALAPDLQDDGIWSGNVVLSPEPVAFYTSVRADAPDVGRVRSAVPADGTWTAWVKQDGVVDVPDGVEATQFRDPFVHRDPSGQGWRMLVGGATPDGAAAWAFSSPDLVSWAYDGVAASRASSETDGAWTGQGWECPVLVEVDGQVVLLVSVWEPDRLHHLAYAVCSPSWPELHPGRWRRLSYGPSYYAASTFTDEDGRPGLVAWLRDVADPDGAWAGAHSLPLTVTLDGDRLVARPHDVLTSRRSPAPPGVLPCAADVEWPAEPGSALRTDGVELVASDEEVTIAAGEHVVALPWSGDPVRVVVDGPVLEIYGTLGIAALPLDRAGATQLTWSGAEPVVHDVG